MDTMEMEEAPQELLSCQRKAENLYTAVRDMHIRLSLPFAGTPLPDGSLAQYGNGATLLPSPTEMQDLGALITLGLSSWTQSGKMPTAAAMHSSAASMELDPVAFITTLYSLAMLGAFLPVICSGDLDTAISTLDHLTSAEEQPGTSQNISSKTTRRRQLGASTAAAVDPPADPESSRNAAPDTSSTKKKRKKNPTSSSRKRRKKKSNK